MKYTAIVLMLLLIGTCGAYENAVSVSGDDGRGNVVSASGNASINLSDPLAAVDLVVDCPGEAYYGQPTECDYTVTNSGQTGLQNLTLTDSFGSVNLSPNLGASQNVTATRNITFERGEMATEILRPTADGYLSELEPEDYDWFGEDHNLPLYTHIDEAALNEDDYLINSGDFGWGKWAFFELANPTTIGAGDTINSVTVCCNEFDSWRPVEAPSYGNLGIYIGSTQYTAGDPFELHYDIEEPIHSHTWTVNPNTGVGWTLANIQDLQAGIFLNAVNQEQSSPSAYQVWVVVDYTAEAAGGKPMYAYAQ